MTAVPFLLSQFQPAAASEPFYLKIRLRHTLTTEPADARVSSSSAPQCVQDLDKFLLLGEYTGVVWTLEESEADTAEAADGDYVRGQLIKDKTESFCEDFLGMLPGAQTPGSKTTLITHHPSNSIASFPEVMLKSCDTQ